MVVNLDEVDTYELSLSEPYTARIVGVNKRPLSLNLPAVWLKWCWYFRQVVEKVLPNVTRTLLFSHKYEGATVYELQLLIYVTFVMKYTVFLCLFFFSGKWLHIPVPVRPQTVFGLSNFCIAGVQNSLNLPPTIFWTDIDW